MGIRFKVILPYLLLTLLLAITGVYVVTELVTNSLSERLTNQLLESGRVVSDEIARQEISHIEVARIIAYTTGLAEAIVDKDIQALRDLAMPVAAGLAAENLFLFNDQGDELLHLIQRSDGGLAEIGAQPSAELNSLVQNLLEEKNPDSLPQRIITTDPVAAKHYYFTALLFPLRIKQSG
ncbi:MAG: hypothetical protein GY755_00660 [Chloroflexi bacterium]|nr:hypothetical protein [Chloroflexota bacterium]